MFSYELSPCNVLIVKLDPMSLDSLYIFVSVKCERNTELKWSIISSMALMLKIVIFFSYASHLALPFPHLSIYFAPKHPRTNKQKDHRPKY